MRIQFFAEFYIDVCHLSEEDMILQSESWATFCIFQKLLSFLGTQMLALPLGVEPRSSVPETNVLSIELQEQMKRL